MNTPDKPRPSPSGPLSPDGSLRFDSTQETIGPSTSPTTFDALSLRAHGSLRITPERSVFRADSEPIFGRHFLVTITFVGPRIESIELFAHQGTDGKSWDNWTRDNELARKALHESWAEQAFGAPLVDKPIILDDPPAPPATILPKPRGADYPRHALFPWGEVVSVYDDKGGFASLIISYR